MFGHDWIVLFFEDWAECKVSNRFVVLKQAKIKEANDLDKWADCGGSEGNFNQLNGGVLREV